METLAHHKNFTEMSEDELMSCGNFACPGCGASLAMRLALKALGKETIMVIPACCWAVIVGPFPYSAIDVPVLQTAFETAAIAAGSVRYGLEATGRKGNTNVVAWAGDGGTFDIGFGALSAAAERNDDIIYVCYDNEAYMNTGIQRSSATPWGAWTTTTPGANFKRERKKNLMEIMAAHRIPYAATATIAYPDDLVAKFEKAKKIKGFKLLHIFSPCPPGHKIVERDSVLLSRLAVASRVFPLFEIFEGEEYKLSMNPEKIPIEEYLNIQGRFKHLSPESKSMIQTFVDEDWNRLMKRMTA